MTLLDECMQARIMHAHLFYLGIDDFVLKHQALHMILLVPLVD